VSRALPQPSQTARTLRAVLEALPPERRAYVEAAALHLFLEAAADGLTAEDLDTGSTNLGEWLPEHAEAQAWA